jgi:KDO2-lipid IV(A) lauroyltransferase
VPFFGVPTGTVAGPASLALHTGAALLPVFFLVKPDGTFHVTIHPPVPTVSTGCRDTDVKRIMTVFNEELESMIRQHPEQWLWLHNRWKSAFEEKNRDRAWEGREAERDSAFARWHK